MPATISNFTGDGVTGPRLDTFVQLPDTGTNVLVAGSVTATGGPLVPIIGSPLTMPAAPGSGSTFWNIQVDSGTGAASVQQSATADPAPISPTALVVFRQILIPGQVNPALGGSATPDTW